MAAPRHAGRGARSEPTQRLVATNGIRLNDLDVYAGEFQRTGFRGAPSTGIATSTATGN